MSGRGYIFWPTKKWILFPCISFNYSWNDVLKFNERRENMKNDIQESYCSFEVSKLLKEKGFDIRCSTHYAGEEIYITTGKTGYNSQFLKQEGETYKKLCHRPTHALAIEWIRVNFRNDFFLNFFPYTYRNKLLYEIRIFGHHFRSSGHKTPQEAIEAALLYTLKNLI